MSEQKIEMDDRMRKAMEMLAPCTDEELEELRQIVEALKEVNVDVQENTKALPTWCDTHLDGM